MHSNLNFESAAAAEAQQLFICLGCLCLPLRFTRDPAVCAGEQQCSTIMQGPATILGSCSTDVLGFPYLKSVRTKVDLSGKFLLDLSWLKNLTIHNRNPFCPHVKNDAIIWNFLRPDFWAATKMISWFLDGQWRRVKPLKFVSAFCPPPWPHTSLTAHAFVPRFCSYSKHHPGTIVSQQQRQRFSKRGATLCRAWGTAMAWMQRTIFRSTEARYLILTQTRTRNFGANAQTHIHLKTSSALHFVLNLESYSGIFNSEASETIESEWRFGISQRTSQFARFD